MAKKTIKIEDLKKYVNDYNLHSADDLKQGREEVSRLLNQMLMDADNYHGFNYLDAREMKESKNGTTIGIREQKTDGSWNFDDTDRTRVRYY